jgi:hypothetical protein
MGSVLLARVVSGCLLEKGLNKMTGLITMVCLIAVGVLIWLP